MKRFDRRKFLKVSGSAGLALGGVGMGFFGYEAGRDPNSYTGCEVFQGAVQTFNRKKYGINTLPYEKKEKCKRADPRVEMIFARISSLRKQWKEDLGIKSLDENIKEYYKNFPEDLKLDLEIGKELFPKMIKDDKKYGNKFFLAKAWSNAMGSVSPPKIVDPPEISDFPEGKSITKPKKMKDSARTSKLIKMIAHQLGSVLVGITKLNPDWVYKYPISGRGFDVNRPLDIPEHWKYAIVVGTPMSWDPLFANPNYGTSYDAYSKSRIVAYRLASFIKQLGFAARPHTPGMDYDLLVPPILIDAGIGEQGRHSVVVTPELGSNFRPAIVTTNLPLKPDKPIKFGVEEFCNTCKICADNCPSNAITREGKKFVRGYKKYQLNISRCHNFWYSNLGNFGCRLCVAVCPYTRKSNWLHRTALHISSNDPTGVSHKGLTLLQKAFYPAPDPSTYYIPSLGGKNASYRKPPWWLKSEDFIDF